MKVLAFLVPWLIIGAGVVFVAFSGGPSRARRAYLTAGGRFFLVAIPLLYIGLGIAIPVLAIADRKEGTGATSELAQSHPSSQVEKGKELFRQACASCHTLAAVNARGVTGPDLDQLAPLTKARVEGAIERGGVGDRMPPNLLQGDNKAAVAAFVAQVAGK